MPAYNISFWLGATHPFCVVIPVINEGDRIAQLILKLHALSIHTLADVIIIDGGSTDGSLNLEMLKKNYIRGLLVKKDFGKLSAQLRCAYAFCLNEGYEGIITIDGNGKDDPSSIPDFIQALKAGVDFVQASRFLPGGQGKNTPWFRHTAIRLIHVPMLRFFSGFSWTDTTQGFRGYSRNLLCDPKIAPFRDIFKTYELLAYLSYRAPKLGYTCKELPTIRSYPKGEIPTKISRWRGPFSLLFILFKACLGFYNPR